MTPIAVRLARSSRPNELNPALGTIERVSDTFGTFFTERALTVDKNRFLVGMQLREVRFSELDGRNLRNGSFVTTANQFVDEADPFDVETLVLRLTMRSVTTYGMFGPASGVEIGFRTFPAPVRRGRAREPVSWPALCAGDCKCIEPRYRRRRDSRQGQAARTWQRAVGGRSHGAVTHRTGRGSARLGQDCLSNSRRSAPSSNAGSPFMQMSGCRGGSSRAGGLLRSGHGRSQPVPDADRRNRGTPSRATRPVSWKCRSRTPSSATSIHLGCCQ